MFGNLFGWLKRPVEEVPDDIAVCEFECRRTQCRQGDWQHCERRLQASAAPSLEQDERNH
ncbi:MAG: hypothetical protein PVI50_07305 [Gammaproteobacteria bacterium]|jgi:hypothetical protein